ncbi:phosphate ABC transporter permease PstA [Porticoccaceae bacterium]|jgi:phosphate transport system permease protein|nr:phosphate ABC transporter permease PstA [Porticoccaceae bacterium]
MDNLPKIKRSLKRRSRSEARFRWYGRIAIILGLAAVFTLFVDIISKGHGAFKATYIQLEVHYDPDVIGINSLTDKSLLMQANWDALPKQALRNRFSDVSGRRDKRKLYKLVSNGAGFDLKDRLLANPDLFGKTETRWILVDDDIDTYYKSWLDGEPYAARLSAKQVQWIDQLHQQGQIRLQLNTNLLTRGDSREPEQAGIRGAVVGSLLTLLLTLMLSFPIGVAAAIYLEEFAAKNRFTDFIEVNINNLAAVPSIIFGLLGLAVFINFFHVPRSVPIVGGLVLTLMTLPTIIITSRAAIKSVPPSIREAALGMGASRYQVVIHHVLPLALPGMLTGAIIGMAQALGETAPLLMIGMVAFIVDIPQGFTDPATVLPVQIFLWADSPERAFIEKTSAAIMVLLSFLLIMNISAVWLRKRLERRW